MKRYIAVLEIDDDEEIVGDANISYTYRSNGTNYGTDESVELKAEDEGQRMKTYEDGLNDAWKAARRIFAPKCKGGLNVVEINQIFFNNNPRGLNNVFDDYSALEAVTKIKEYEEEQKEAAEIKVGDEVIYDREKCIVTAIANGGYTVMLLGLGGGYMVRTTRDEIQGKRTGRHFPEIVNVLKQMQEGEE